MKKTALVIMAAGIGSRFGKGIKQLEPVGPCGEIIMDYSIHDALEAGFDKVVFIIRKDLEKDFKEVIGNRIEKITEVQYVFQELENLPEGFEKPQERKKPWGTGQAVLSCKGVVKEPFMVINADDYYGKEAYVKLHEFLVKEPAYVAGAQAVCMAGFILGNTLSENGGVTRGICKMDADNHLTAIKETHNIVRNKDGAAILQEDGTLADLPMNAHVSMNMWGLQPEFLDILEEGFVEFLSNIEKDDIKSEYLLPIMIDQLIQEKKVCVTVLETSDHWFGVTYQEDKETVVNAFRELIEQGKYHRNLFD